MIIYLYVVWMLAFVYKFYTTVSKGKGIVLRYAKDGRVETVNFLPLWVIVDFPLDYEEQEKNKRRKHVRME